MSSDEEASSSDSEDEEYAMEGNADRKYFKCGDPNYFISDCPKHSYGDQKVFVRGLWSDSDEDLDLKKDEICLMAHESK
ncbi:hypothetical protein Tco_0115308, partial [Tanacetum coccineum]